MAAQGEYVERLKEIGRIGPESQESNAVLQFKAGNQRLERYLLIAIPGDDQVGVNPLAHHLGKSSNQHVEAFFRRKPPDGTDQQALGREAELLPGSSRVAG